MPENSVSGTGNPEQRILKEQNLELLRKRKQEISQTADFFAQELLRAERVRNISGPPWNHEAFVYKPSENDLHLAIILATERIHLTPSEKEIFVKQFSEACARGYPEQQIN